ncbi:MAG: hypothetical protein WA220_10615 [Candidatus Nitrosopolaris sp.]
MRDSYQFAVFEFSSNNCHVLDSRAAVLPYVVSSTPENFRRKIMESIHFTNLPRYYKDVPLRLPIKGTLLKNKPRKLA